MKQIEKYLGIKSSSKGVWTTENEIAYVSNASGVAQIYKLDLNTNQHRQVTFFSERVMDIMSYENHGIVLFTMDTGGNEQEQIYAIDANDQITQLSDNAAARYNLGGMDIQQNRLIYASNARSRANFDIVSMDLETKEETIVIENSDNYNIPDTLSPNGKYLVYNKMNAISDNCIWLANLASSETKRVPENQTVAAYSSARWLNDSSGFYFVNDSETNFSKVYFYDLDKKKSSLVYEDDSWGIDNLSLSSDERYLAILVNTDGYSKLVIFDCIEKVEINTIQPPKGVISAHENMNWSSKTNRLLFSLSSGKRNEDVWMLDVEHNMMKQLTNSDKGGLSSDDLVEPILLHYESFDGLVIPFWLYKPQGVELSNLPVLIDIHGGPEGQKLPNFDPIVQYLVSQGIAVVGPNIRGSVGYGKVYTHLDDKEKRLDSIEDIRYLVNFLNDNKISDPSRVAVKGGSYGGFMTLSCAARLPELFCAAVDVVGMFNLVTFLENTSDYRRAHRESEYGTLANDRELLYNVSPVSKVDDIRGPLMVIHGANDPRVPVSEAEAVVDYLRNKNIEVEYLRYEDEGHGIAKLTNKIDYYPKMSAFLKKHMKIN